MSTPSSDPRIHEEAHEDEVAPEALAAVLAISSSTWGEPDHGAADRLGAAIAGVASRVHRGELTIVVPARRWRDAMLHMRDEEGYDYLSDVVVTDWMGYQGTVAGYFSSGGTLTHDMNRSGSWGKSVVPDAPGGEKRFSVSSHLLKLMTVPQGQHRRVRMQAWLDDGESIETLVPVYPSSDFHEREAFDLMGIVFDGHPNLRRILMPEYWEGHPQRKDYPMGGEQVQFSDDLKDGR
jgi:NADH-quinone oxidoreductase subunit C